MRRYILYFLIFATVLFAFCGCSAAPSDGNPPETEEPADPDSPATEPEDPGTEPSEPADPDNPTTEPGNPSTEPDAPEPVIPEEPETPSASEGSYAIAMEYLMYQAIPSAIANFDVYPAYAEGGPGRYPLNGDSENGYCVYEDGIYTEIQVLKPLTISAPAAALPFPELTTAGKMSYTNDSMEFTDFVLTVTEAYGCPQEFSFSPISGSIRSFLGDYFKNAEIDLMIGDHHVTTESKFPAYTINNLIKRLGYGEITFREDGRFEAETPSPSIRGTYTIASDRYIMDGIAADEYGSYDFHIEVILSPMAGGYESYNNVDIRAFTFDGEIFSQRSLYVLNAMQACMI